MNALAAQLLLAMAAGALFGLPLFGTSVVLARPFSSAAARYRVHAAAFVAAAALTPLAFGAAFVRPAGAGGVRELERTLAQHVPIAVLVAVALVAAILLADLAVDLIRLLRIKARSSVDPALPRQCRRAPVAATSRVRTPTAIGYLHPRIVVPSDLRARVSAQEWRAIVAHENAHLQRYDDWSKAFQTAAVRLCWYSPALWALAARLDLERELASDERAVDAIESRAYAACLVRLAADVRRPRAAPAAWASRSQVALRVERLLQPAPRASGRFAAAARVAAFAAIVAINGAAAVAVVPAASERGVPPVAVLARVPASLPHPRRTKRAAHAAKPAARRAAVPRMPAAPSPVARLPRRTVRLPKLLALSPGAPCRTCVLLRRPVTDGPAVPSVAPAQIRTPAPRLTAKPVETGTGEASAAMQADLWSPDLLRAVFIAPRSR